MLSSQQLSVIHSALSHTRRRFCSAITTQRRNRDSSKTSEVKKRRKTKEKMAIGKDSRKSSVRSSIRAPKFLDKSSGFYGRLDELDMPTEGRGVEENMVDDSSRVEVTVVQNSGPDERGEAEDFTEGMMEDDGETLLERKPSRRSSRWRRSSRRKQKEGKAEEEQARDERPSLGTESLEVVVEARVQMEIELEKLKKMEEENGKEPTLVHFPVREEADDQVLIRDKKRGREEEGEEERKMRREQEEGMKVVKRKNYRKALDRALRRGWEAFITNLYSVTLTPVMSSPSPTSPSSKNKLQHNSVLAEFQ
ncbi:cilia- and flagella-associated protein 251 [Acanthochromis polyacanthus]|uniref:cilia- and flagella-associated protein 251 n=1 Tax=Acanthochromis polyacanthus TaxID=80966 RepID=UPI000B8F7A4B|nr:cilia- and flagella-associated protein 251 [Acanthochromis polyacanthus]